MQQIVLGLSLLVAAAGCAGRQVTTPDRATTQVDMAVAKLFAKYPPKPSGA